MHDASPHAQVDTADERVAALERALKESEAANAKLRSQLERVREAYQLQRQELELLRRRIFIAKAERIDTKQLQMQFDAKEAEVEALKKTLDDSAADTPEINNNNNNGSNNARPKRSTKPRGRRDLSDADLPVIRCEVLDPEFEDLVRQGDAVRVGSDTTYKLAWERGGLRKVAIERATYRLRTKDNRTIFSRAELPPQAFDRCLAAPSLLAYIVHAKLGMGLPLYRLERDMGRSLLELCRGTMSRWLENAGATLGATIIEAARREALANAFCISTDATGILVQPEPLPSGQRQPCARGHFFVQIADRDHVFFEYTAKEDGKSVAEMFAGFRGYVQADAKSVFNILYQPIAKNDDDDEVQGGMTEVGCFAHCRRKFWEAAVILKHKVAQEGLYRISRIYEVDGKWRGQPVDEITVNRREHLRPMVEDFFRWVQDQYVLEKPRRGLLRKALGYAARHEAALKRFLDDGRLNIDNNASERGLKDIAIGRKAWLFIGSDDHGVATGHLLSMIASARLHDLDPEQYLRDIFRVLGHWPRDRYIELSAKYWSRTRARLDPCQLAAEVGHLKVPPPEQ